MFIRCGSFMVIYADHALKITVQGTEISKNGFISGEVLLIALTFVEYTPPIHEMKR